MAPIRDPRVEPVTPHPDSISRHPVARRRSRWPTVAGVVLATLLALNVGLIVALALGSPTNRGPTTTELIARWNAETADADLTLAADAPICGRDGVTVAGIVTVSARCTNQIVGQLHVAVALSAGRSQEILDLLESMFADPSDFETTANGLTFDVTVSSPDLSDPSEPPPVVGAEGGSSDRFYERPALMYSVTMVVILAVHAVARLLHSRPWPVLLALSIAGWGAVLAMDLRFLSSGRSLGALAAVTFTSVAVNLVALAAQAPEPRPVGLTTIDLRPIPEIDLTREPARTSPRWGTRGVTPHERRPR